ncbi:hypothetical protein N9L68_04610 [bacterium]|nr:hypothetical protein [bacterium]
MILWFLPLHIISRLIIIMSVMVHMFVALIISIVFFIFFLFV